MLLYILLIITYFLFPVAAIHIRYMYQAKQKTKEYLAIYIQQKKEGASYLRFSSVEDVLSEAQYHTYWGSSDEPDNIPLITLWPIVFPIVGVNNLIHWLKYAGKNKKIAKLQKKVNTALAKPDTLTLDQLIEERVGDMSPEEKENYYERSMRLHNIT